MVRSLALSAGHSPGEASTRIDAAPQHQPAIGFVPELVVATVEYSLAAEVPKTNPYARHSRGYEPTLGGRPLLPQTNGWKEISLAFSSFYCLLVRRGADHSGRRYQAGCHLLPPSHLSAAPPPSFL